MKNRLYLSSPTMHGEEILFIQKAIETNWVAPLGFNCDLFEQEMETFLFPDGKKTHQALTLVSGTAAIHLALKLAGIAPGETVFCSDLTFAASANPVIYEGGNPVFIDSEENSWNMSPESLELAFRQYPGTKYVILVHLYGSPAKMNEITEICRKHNAILIEDAAEALSSTYHGKQCGTFGKYGIFSFNGNKIITTSGGGMLLTDSAEDRSRALFLATQAREKAPWYQHEKIGYNYRMSNLLAGVGRGQLIHLKEHRAEKEKIYRYYESAFRDIPIKMNPFLPGSIPNFWLSCITIESEKISPAEIIRTLEKENIESRHIWKPMHLQPVFRNYPFVSAESVPVSEKIFFNGLCLPSDIKITPSEQDFIIELVKSCF